jgi:microcystin-dependent protein
VSSILGAEEGARAEGLQDDRPLTDEERQLLQRLLSDPFSIPMPFKTWLISFLEGSDLLLPRSSVQGLASLLGTGGDSGVLGLLPAGLLWPYAGGTVPKGAFMCDGSTRSRTQYKRLFDAIGVIHGGGDGSTTFNLPDYRRRVLFGAASGGEYVLGVRDNLPEASRELRHHHFISQTTDSKGSHSHGGSIGGGGHEHNVAIPNMTTFQSPTGQQYNEIFGDYLGDIGRGTTGGGGHSHSIGSDGSHTHVLSGDTQGGGMLDRPAFAVVAYIINW